MEKTLESPLDCKEIHQSILKEISPEYSLEGQGASRVVPGKSSLHASGEGERVIALESWEGLGPPDAFTLLPFTGATVLTQQKKPSPESVKVTMSYLCTGSLS